MSEETQELSQDIAPLLHRRWVRTAIFFAAAFAGFAVGRWGLRLEVNWSMVLASGSQFIASLALPSLPEETERDHFSWDGALLFFGVLMVFFLFVAAVMDSFTI